MRYLGEDKLKKITGYVKSMSERKVCVTAMGCAEYADALFKVGTFLTSKPQCSPEIFLSISSSTESITTGKKSNPGTASTESMVTA
jgi:hypothetical protein